MPGTGPASPVGAQGHPSPGTCPAVPDGAEVPQPLSLQGSLFLQHVLQLLLHGWRVLDPLTGHELTGYPDTLTPWRKDGGQGGWERRDETHGKNIQNSSTLPPLPAPSSHMRPLGCWGKEVEGREGGGRRGD